MREILVHLNIERPGEPLEVDAPDDGFANATADEVLRRLANPLYGLPAPLFEHVKALVEMDLDACAEYDPTDEQEVARHGAGQELQDWLEGAAQFRAENPPLVTSADVADLGLVVVPLAEEI